VADVALKQESTGSCVGTIPNRYFWQGPAQVTDVYDWTRVTAEVLPASAHVALFRFLPTASSRRDC
jgi:hypothetical protein